VEVSDATSEDILLITAIHNKCYGITPTEESEFLSALKERFDDPAVLQYPSAFSATSDVEVSR
jgi:hypothetical protein